MELGVKPSTLFKKSIVGISGTWNLKISKSTLFQILQRNYSFYSYRLSIHLQYVSFPDIGHRCEEELFSTKIGEVLETVV